MDHMFLIPGISRTNLFRNSAFVGAVSGTPGTAPTSWSRGGSPAGTQTYSAVDESLRIAVVSQRLDVRQTVALAANTVYCASIFADVYSTATWQNMLTVLSSPSGTTWAWQQDSDTVVTNPSAFPALRNGCTMKLIITTVGTAGNAVISFGGGILSNQTSDMKFWQPQIENGNNRTGYERTV